MDLCDSGGINGNETMIFNFYCAPGQEDPNFAPGQERDVLEL